MRWNAEFVIICGGSFFVYATVIQCVHIFGMKKKSECFTAIVITFLFFTKWSGQYISLFQALTQRFGSLTQRRSYVQIHSPSFGLSSPIDAVLNPFFLFPIMSLNRHIEKQSQGWLLALLCKKSQFRRQRNLLKKAGKQIPFGHYFSLERSTIVTNYIHR